MQLSRFLSHALPDPRYFSYDIDQFDDYRIASPDEAALDSDGILDGPGLNWGGSTLEVVRSQAIFLTRSAAFGPRITDDAGLKGFLLPISDFYKIPKEASFSTSDASRDPVHACPYKGGPGSRRDVLMDRYEDEDDRRLYSSFHPDSPSQASFTWTHGGDDGLQASPKPPHDWIALVERGGGCGFADKVRVAQELGAVAVVVGDAPSPGWHGGRSGDPNEEGDPGLSGKRLITMFAPGDTSDLHIPSTFVTRPSYLDLERLIQETEKDQEDWQKQHPSQHDEPPRPPMTRGLEIVIGKDDMVWEWPLIDFGILLLLLPSFMTVITIVVHRIRMVRQRRKERAPELVVLGLPCLIWRGNGQPWEKVEGADVDPGPGNGGATSPTAGGDFGADDLEAGRAGETIPLLGEENEPGPSQRAHTAVKMPPLDAKASANPSAFLPPGRTYFSTDECAICLCDFVDGDRVRVLPCGHIFHRQEVDDWLVRVKKLCPICKRDITVPVPPAPPVGVAGSTVAGAGAGEEQVVVPAVVGQQQVQGQEEGDESVDLIQHLSSGERPEGRQV
ncbi:RING-type domain-containing protein [Pseudozyma hubeiensis]|nr:RING-type domain-containing protein [Pseudozyma hubeiensis]